MLLEALRERRYRGEHIWGSTEVYSRGRVPLGHPHRVVIAGPISGQSDCGKWRDAICYTVEIMWLCNDPLLIDKKCGTLSCFVAYIVVNDVALDELAIRQRDCYSIWVSKSNSAARVDVCKQART